LTPQEIFQRLSRRHKQSSDIPVGALNNFLTYKLTLGESLPQAGQAGGEDHPLDTLERYSLDLVGAAIGSSDVPVSAQNLMTIILSQVRQATLEVLLTHPCSCLHPAFVNDLGQKPYSNV